MALANQLSVRVFEEDTWVEDTYYLVQLCAWALITTVPSNVPYAPGTLAVDIDMIYRKNIMVDWGLLERKIVKKHIANNIKKNRNRREHKYNKRDLVLKYHYDAL